jgi:Glycosyltransferase 61
VNFARAVHAAKVLVGEDLLANALRALIRRGRWPAGRIARVAPGDEGPVRFHLVHPALPLAPCTPEFHDDDEVSRQYVELVRTWGPGSSADAGVITAPGVEVSFPTGVNRREGKVLVQAFADDAVLVNPKYVLEIERMPLRRKRSDVGEGVLLTAPWHHNFFHWMVELLPRLLLVSAIPELRRLPLLVPRSAPRFVEESLRLTGHLERTRFLPDGVYRFDRLHLLGRLASRSTASPLGVEWLRRSFDLGEPRKRRRLYISRRDANIRFVANEAEVEACLGRFGFESVSLAGKPLLEQARLFRDAEMIVGSHGAGFSHLAFAHPGTVLVEIFQRGHFNHCFNRLAAINRLRYGFVVGEPTPGGGIAVDVARLGRVMDSATGAGAMPD